MKTLYDLNAELQKAARAIRSIQKAAQYDDYSDLSGLEIDFKDGEEIFLWKGLKDVMEDLDRVLWDIEYLGLPVTEEGTLCRNRNGRYELPGGREFTSGSGIEVLVSDDYQEVPYWKIGRIEHNGNDYYFTGAPDMPLQGMTARRRERR